MDLPEGNRTNTETFLTRGRKSGPRHREENELTGRGQLRASRTFLHSQSAIQPSPEIMRGNVPFSRDKQNTTVSYVDLSHACNILYVVFLLGPLTRRGRCDDQLRLHKHGTYVPCSGTQQIRTSTDRRVSRQFTSPRDWHAKKPVAQLAPALSSTYSQGCPITWPARSPDLTLLEYFLWSLIKCLIYQTSVESKEELLARVMAAADLGCPGIGDRVYQNMVSWAEGPLSREEWTLGQGAGRERGEIKRTDKLARPGNFSFRRNRTIDKEVYLIRAAAEQVMQGERIRVVVPLSQTQSFADWLCIAIETVLPDWSSDDVEHFPPDLPEFAVYVFPPRHDCSAALSYHGYENPIVQPTSRVLQNTDTRSRRLPFFTAGHAARSSIARNPPTSTTRDPEACCDISSAQATIWKVQRTPRCAERTRSVIQSIFFRYRPKTIRPESATRVCNSIPVIPWPSAVAIKLRLYFRLFARSAMRGNEHVTMLLLT
ncbi:hypothetical protein PR048_003080 [Dryococelus australis]|uniref:Uncharacterized protein n=1 Tax=Dryococelus australis TaxID=614101 RepID=A0ABQ9INI1_9NEOP|nr:hypothetical protein PR048_003080 [Dryococelus australis]